MARKARPAEPPTPGRKGRKPLPSHAPPTEAAAAAAAASPAAATASPAADAMEAEAGGVAIVYDALPGLTLAFSPEEEEHLEGATADLGGASTSASAAVVEEVEDATAAYSVFRNEITAAGDALVDIPAADFFSLDVSAAVEDEPATPRALSPQPAPEATLSGSLAPAEQPAQGSERAWFRGGRRFRSPMLQLHKEILDFCDFISPSAEEQSSRTAAVKAVSNVEVFGSFRTGLFLPTSDIDVVIFDSRVKTPQVGLYALAKALSQKGVAKKIQVIAKARVPIVKFVERKSEIAFDISFDMDGGPQAADFIKDYVKKFPALRHLCMILKVFLHQRELNEVYTGGIGSYALLTMLITHLQLVWGGKDILGYRKKEHNLGILLVPDNDIGKNSFNYFKVKSAFSKAYSVLTDANLITSLGPNRSILGTIVRPDSVLLDRKGWNKDATIPDMLTEPWEPLPRQFDSDNDAVYNWHVIDDEPLPRNTRSTSEDTSPSPTQKRKSSKPKQRSRKKAKADSSSGNNAENGFKRGKGLAQCDRSHQSAGSSRRSKGPREYDRFTNTLPQYTQHISRW
uniref:polynucleotide adenylyltransferase n=1 Tax=Oryza glumipatula TaxID=40148 RepID=A0A0D9YD03_9ORYZ